MHLAGCARGQFGSSWAYQTRWYHGPDQKQVAVIVTVAPDWSPVGSACYFLIIIVIRHETASAARWALLLIVRTLFDHAITVAVRTGFSFHVCLPADIFASLTRQPNVMHRGSIASFVMWGTWAWCTTGILLRRGMSAFGTKRTLQSASAFGGKADIGRN